MRLKHVYISEYKNLKDFSLDFDGDSFIDIFVGKNGSGKSNLLEALIEIFRQVYEQDSSCEFEYKVQYTIGDKEVLIEWREGRFYLNNGKRGLKNFTTQPLPDNILIYYSGHNDTVNSLVSRYEENFRKNIRGASVSDTRRFIGIGPNYKSLLMSVLLLQPESCMAKRFICQKLDIDKINDTVQINLKRPKFAESRFQELKKIHKIETSGIEEFDPRTHYWGADGITLDFLKELVSCVKGEVKHSSVYDSSKDTYSIPISIELFQKKFKEGNISEQFRKLDNLKTLGLLTEIELDFSFNDGRPASLAHFSDGQLQSVYIYAITEIFKDKDCITLLDEPDAFLHPEWQFEFLKQVVDISEEATKSNHIILSSHSASTIAKVDESSINLFDFENDKVVINKVKKSEVIKSLSAGLISFTEGEAKLNIQHILKNSSGPVLFTEGITDEIIIETAWDKLYPEETREFEVQGAFDRIFLRNLFSRDELKKNYPNRALFALFDFDEAYDDWNGLEANKKGELEEDDPMKGLCKQLKHKEHFAFLLPVPDCEVIKPQVLDGDGNPWGSGVNSHLAIETLFFDEELLGEWFEKKALPGGGEMIEFSGDKVKFAEEVIPNLDALKFEVLRPIFEFINTIINEKRKAA